MSVESLYIPIPRLCLGIDEMCPLIAITLSCNTIWIIFVAGLKGDKFNGSIGILSALGLFVKCVKFKPGLKNRIDR